LVEFVGRVKGGYQLAREIRQNSIREKEKKNLKRRTNKIGNI
jgi:hypothetical protein